MKYTKDMKKQVVVIHGGDTFETYEEYLEFLNTFELDVQRYKTDRDDWKKPLRMELGEEYEVILPQMPNKWNARYEEWKIWMDKLVPFLNDDVILVGHSMGGAFLVKYLSLNPFPKKIKAVFLVAAVFDGDFERSLASFTLPNTLKLQTENIFLYHSRDDHVVPFSALEKFQRELPNAHVRIFEDRKHINQEKFPELVEDIRNLS